MTIIDQLRKAVKERATQLGSLNMLAREVGIDQPNLCNFVQKKRGLSEENINKLCRYLKLVLVHK